MQDKWRLKPRFTLNYGLAYHYEDRPCQPRSKQAHLSFSTLGIDGLAPTEHDKNNFAPSLGLAWAVTQDHKTVLRARRGPLLRVAPGSRIGCRNGRRLVHEEPGRIVVNSSLIPNPVPGLPTVPLGRPLNFQDGPRAVHRGSASLSILPERSQRSRTAIWRSPTAADLSIRNIEVFKQGS